MAPSHAQITTSFMFPLPLPTTVHLCAVNAARAFTSPARIELLKRAPGKGERRSEESLPLCHKGTEALGERLSLFWNSSIWL